MATRPSTLEWGDDIANGKSSFDRQLAPTPQPLANAVGALLSLLGAGGVLAFTVVGTLSFGALGFTAFRLGAVVFSAPVGALFALVLLTREEVALQHLFTYVDIPYLALIFGALALEAARPRRGGWVLGLLGLAGLLRPEAWILTGAYAVWLATGRPRAEWPRLALAAAAAPLLWLGFDFVATGDPLHSLAGTRSLAEELARPRTIGDALVGAPTYIRWNLDDAVVIYGGVAGALGALWLAWERAAFPVAVVGLSLMTFLGLGLAGLPVLARYVALPSAMLALFFSFAVLGWTSVPTTGRLATGWKVLSGILALALVASTPAAWSRLDRKREAAALQRTYQNDLGDLATSTGWRPPPSAVGE